MPCRAYFDGYQWTTKTHTCDLPTRHDGPHHCPTCDSYWTRREGLINRAERVEDGTT